MFCCNCLFFQTPALKSGVRGLVLARDLGKASLIIGMEARLRALEPNVSVEQLLDQWGAEIDDRPDGVVLHTENQQLISIDQRLEKLRIMEEDY